MEAEVVPVAQTFRQRFKALLFSAVRIYAHWWRPPRAENVLYQIMTSLCLSVDTSDVSVSARSGEWVRAWQAGRVIYGGFMNQGGVYEKEKILGSAD